MATSRTYAKLAIPKDARHIARVGGAETMARFAGLEIISGDGLPKTLLGRVERLERNPAGRFRPSLARRSLQHRRRKEQQARFQLPH
jgi:hypothetical protein